MKPCKLIVFNLEGSKFSKDFLGIPMTGWRCKTHEIEWASSNKNEKTCSSYREGTCKHDGKFSCKKCGKILR